MLAIPSCYEVNDIRAEHVIAFFSRLRLALERASLTQDWAFAEQLADKFGGNPNYIKVYLGSWYSYDKVGFLIEQVTEKGLKLLRQIQVDPRCSQIITE